MAVQIDMWWSELLDVTAVKLARQRAAQTYPKGHRVSFKRWDPWETPEPNKDDPVWHFDVDEPEAHDKLGTIDVTIAEVLTDLMQTGTKKGAT